MTASGRTTTEHRTTAGLAQRLWRSGPWAVGTGAAYQPWRDWPKAQGARRLVHAAILAANAHDTQPWLFHANGETITVFADFDRHLGSFDPFRREMHLSIGCALENLAHAAKSQGFVARIELPPAMLGLAPPLSPNEPVAIVRLTRADPVETGLFNAIPRRHTHRGAFLRDRTISTRLLAGIQALAQGDASLRFFLFAGSAKAPLAALIVSATKDIIADRQMAADNARWFRFNFDEVQEFRDGLTLDTNVVPTLQNVAAKIFPPSEEAAGRHWIRDTERVHVGTAPLLGIIAVRDLYDRPTTLNAGRLWQRLHLWLTARDLAAQPLNQPVERVDRERQLNGLERTAPALEQITGDAAWHPTFIFRAGYAKQAARLSPRRPVEAVMI
jgi:hypothetical protein